MPAHAEGEFTVKGWEENDLRDLGGGTKLTKATMTFAFEGEIAAEGVAETVMFYRSDGTAVYTGLQRMTGQVGGRDGTFVVLADGTFEGGTATTRWQVIAGSGTGDLTGLTGSGEAVAASGNPGGTCAFDYDLA